MNIFAKYPNVLIVKFIFAILLMSALITSAYAEEMVVKKITLGHFKVKNNEIELSKSEPYWSKIDRHNLAVDDKDRIYILSILNREILVFSKTGTVAKKIPLPIEPIKKNLDDYGQLEVSGDGKRFFVSIPAQGHWYEPGYSKSREFILNDESKIIKEFSDKERDKIFFPDVRLCNETYVSLPGGYVLDENFNLLKGKFTFAYPATEGSYVHKYEKVKGHMLIKYAKDGTKLWENKIDGNFRIIGADLNNYLYLDGILKKSDPNSLYKLNSKGDILAQAPLPDPFPFLTQREKDESEVGSSEEVLSFFKLACNGDVFLIYQLTELPSKTFKRWVKGGEYFIYEFETKK